MPRARVCTWTSCPYLHTQHKAHLPWADIVGLTSVEGDELPSVVFKTIQKKQNKRAQDTDVVSTVFGGVAREPRVAPPATAAAPFATGSAFAPATAVRLGDDVAHSAQQPWTSSARTDERRSGDAASLSSGQENLALRQLQPFDVTASGSGSGNQNLPAPLAIAAPAELRSALPIDPAIEDEVAGPGAGQRTVENGFATPAPSAVGNRSLVSEDHEPGYATIGNDAERPDEPALNQKPSKPSTAGSSRDRPPTLANEKKSYRRRKKTLLAKFNELGADTTAVGFVGLAHPAIYGPGRSIRMPYAVIMPTHGLEKSTIPIPTASLVEDKHIAPFMRRDMPATMTAKQAIRILRRVFKAAVGAQQHARAGAAGARLEASDKRVMAAEKARRAAEQRLRKTEREQREQKRAAYVAWHRSREGMRGAGMDAEKIAEVLGPEPEDVGFGEEPDHEDDDAMTDDGHRSSGSE